MIISEKKQSGFTLVETLVAITILMVALIGPFETVEHALTASYQARDELIASSLAQEAVEYVLNIRDNNYLYNKVNGTSRSWLYGLDGTGGSTNCIGNLSSQNGGYCVVDPLRQTVTACTNQSCSTYPLYLSGSGSTYPDEYNQAVDGTLTKFTRKIVINTMSVPNEVKLTVTVSWSTNKQPYTTTITEYIQNWL